MFIGAFMRYFLFVLTLLCFNSAWAETELTHEDLIEQAAYWDRDTKESDFHSGKDFSAPFIRVSKMATPACVFITAEGKKTQSNEPFDLFNDDFFNRFFGNPPQKPSSKPSISQGSGFIVSSDGYVMTNAHVVSGANKILVHMQDDSKRQLEASLIGVDHQTDIAIIKIDTPSGETFPFLKMGNSDNIEVGEWVIAVGNPFGLQSTVTTGIVSAKSRQNLRITDYEDFIQTEAAINPGNSGGPLINLKGLVIGMNTAIYSQSGGHIGLGFAIPQKILSNVKDQLIKKGSVTRGFLGVSLQPIDTELAGAFDLKSTHGALVSSVVNGSPADIGGLKQGDIIIKLNNKKVNDPTQFRNLIVLMPPDTEITLTIIRNGEKKKLRVKLATHGENTLVSSHFEIRALGLKVDNLTPAHLEKHRISESEEGVLIAEVTPNSPAYNAGIRQGSIILMINRQKVKNVRDVEELSKNIQKGDRVLLLIKQGPAFRFYTLQAS